MRRILAAWLVCTAFILSVGALPSPALALGIVDIHAQPSAWKDGDQPEVWLLGPPYDANSLKGEATELISAPFPGSEGCCETIMAIFRRNTGSAIVGSVPYVMAPINQVARVSDTSYVAVAGSCESGGCSLDVFGINTAKHVLSTVLHVFSFGKGQAKAESCGWTIQYEGEPYNLLAVSQQPQPQTTPDYYALIRLGPGPRTCRK